MNNTNMKPHAKDKFQKRFGGGGYSWFITCYSCLYCIAGKRGHLTCITLQRLGRKGGNVSFAIEENWLQLGTASLVPDKGCESQPCPASHSSGPALGRGAILQEQRTTKTCFPYEQGRFVNRWIAADKIIPPPGIPTFHI